MMAAIWAMIPPIGKAASAATPRALADQAKNTSIATARYRLGVSVGGIPFGVLFESGTSSPLILSLSKG
jgi:hypothetical protein